MLEVINLTSPEGAKNLAKRFFEDELKMDLADPRFNNWPEYFIASLLESVEKFQFQSVGIEDEALYMHWQEIRRFSNWMREHRERRTCKAE